MVVSRASDPIAGTIRLPVGHALGGELDDLPLGCCELVAVGAVAGAHAGRREHAFGAGGERQRSAFVGELGRTHERLARLCDPASARIQRTEVGERAGELEPVDRGLERADRLLQQSGARVDIRRGERLRADRRADPRRQTDSPGFLDLLRRERPRALDIVERHRGHNGLRTPRQHSGVRKAALRKPAARALERRQRLGGTALGQQQLAARGLPEIGKQRMLVGRVSEGLAGASGAQVPPCDMPSNQQRGGARGVIAPAGTGDVHRLLRVGDRLVEPALPEAKLGTPVTSVAPVQRGPACYREALALGDRTLGARGILAVDRRGCEKREQHAIPFRRDACDRRKRVVPDLPNPGRRRAEQGHERHDLRDQRRVLRQRAGERVLKQPGPKRHHLGVDSVGSECHARHPHGIERGEQRMLRAHALLRLAGTGDRGRELAPSEVHPAQRTQGLSARRRLALVGQHSLQARERGRPTGRGLGERQRGLGRAADVIRQWLFQQHTDEPLRRHRVSAHQCLPAGREQRRDSTVVKWTRPE